MRDDEPRPVWMSPLITHSRTRGVGRLCERRRGSKGSARGSVHWGCDYATALDIEVDPQRCCLGSRQSDFALFRRQFVYYCST
jgi:hypothetical protein